MTLAETKTYIVELMNSKAIMRYIPNKELCNIVVKSITITLESFDKWEKNEKITLSEQNIADAAKSVDIIQNILLEVIINEDISKFATTYALLTLNWVDNINQQGDIRGPWLDIQVRCKAIKRILDGHYTILELTNVVKKLISRCNYITAKYEPPIELARHYLSTINDRGLCEPSNTTACESKCCEEKKIEADKQFSLKWSDRGI